MRGCEQGRTGGSISALYSEAVILSTGTPIPARWPCRRRCRYSAKGAEGAFQRAAWCSSVKAVSNIQHPRGLDKILDRLFDGEFDVTFDGMLDDVFDRGVRLNSHLNAQLNT